MSTDRTRRWVTVALLAICLLPGLKWGVKKAWRYVKGPVAGPGWIWIAPGPRPNQTVYFRKEFRVDVPLYGAKLIGSCDDRMIVYLNGTRVAEGKSWKAPTFADLSDRVQIGRNVLAIEASNRSGSAGLFVRLALEYDSRPIAPVVTDASWRVSGNAGRGWQTPGFDDASWSAPRVVARLGGAPWNQITETTLLAMLKRREPPATPINRLKTAQGFKVDLLYSVPKDQQGSWVSMALDPKGRLIVSDQYGKLYRVTLPPLEVPGATLKVEPIDVPIGQAQGLLWAFDSLYVVVNSGARFPSGLYRVRDSDGDDRFDTVEQLWKLNGAGEHGPHAVLLGPDGRSIYVLAGNDTKLTEITGSLVPRAWGEDQLLPRLPDGRGFMKDVPAPGGCVYRVDPEGKKWELVCSGFRNPYDAAFNRYGDLLTCDSDMEWDMNTPWYRPSRVCVAASGGEFGWRNGAGVWPPHFPDSLPATVEIGPGSPTGLTFGYGAKFPTRYQEALFVCDWSYGKLYAVHLRPEQSAYTGDFEEFVTGTPLALTDIIVNPHDGAIYFTTGGRRTKSGLYRVTFTGTESTAPAPIDHHGALARAIRRKLEAFHGTQNPAAVSSAWPYLGHPDRFIRFAARVAIEWQEVTSWQDQALAVTDTPTALTALLALARHGDPALQSRQIQALEQIHWEYLANSQRIDLLRVYALTFIRMGPPDRATVERTVRRFDPHFPSSDRTLNAELCRMLVYLQAPSVASKALELLEDAPTQEEQLDYVLHLRVLKNGWTMNLRKAYFSWFLKAANYRGGASFELFVQHIKDDAVACLSAREKAELKPILDAQPAAATRPHVALAADRPFVKAWKVEDLAPGLEKGLSKRNFDRGRALFSAVGCFACHRYSNEGGAIGPDLTGIGGRFSPRDLLESIILPSKEISDQYGAVVIALDDGRVVTGPIVNQFGDTLLVLTDMHNPDALLGVNRSQVEDIKPSPVSMMPTGLLDTLSQDEIMDLLAYLLSHGQREDQMFHAGR